MTHLFVIFVSPLSTSYYPPGSRYFVDVTSDTRSDQQNGGQKDNVSIHWHFGADTNINKRRASKGMHTSFQRRYAGRSLSSLKSQLSYGTLCQMGIWHNSYQVSRLVGWWYGYI